MSQVLTAIRDVWIVSRLAGLAAGLALVAVALLLSPAPVVNAAEITVTTTADPVVTNTTGDGVSLREAIASLNAGADLNSDVTATRVGVYGGFDSVAFNIPGGGVKTIHLSSNMDTIVKPMTIDGYTQPGASANTLANGDNAVILIELDGGTVTSQAFLMDAPDTTIRGLAISFFSVQAIGVDPTAGGSVIEGNFIGTTADGTMPRANGLGISIASGAAVRIGGTAPASRNIISGNVGDGILFGGPGHVTNALIQGNFIGLDKSGTAPIGNGTAGIRNVSASNVTIGGAAPGAGNVIAFNGVVTPSPGVSLTNGAIPPTGVSIRGNSIFANAQLGIDLLGDGVTPNDTGDGDPGPNNLQNYPILTSASVATGSTRVSGTLNSTASSPLVIDLYSNPSCDSPSNQGEGATYLGSIGTTTNASGNVSFAATGLLAAGAGSVITATATDASGNTSEFSACQALVAPGAAVAPTTIAATEGGTTGTFTVQLSSVPTSAVAITPAFSASQVSLSPSTLTFQPDASALTPQTFTVTAIDNAIVDGTRTAPISLAASSSDTAFNGIVLSSVTATLTDNDGTASLNVADATVAEPATASGTGTVSLSVTLSPASAQTVTVQYAMANTSATGGGGCGGSVDYLTAIGTLTFNPGDTSKTATVTICGDAVVEPSETFTFGLTNPTGGAVLGAHPTATVTITDSTSLACTPRPRVSTRVAANSGALQVTIEPTPLNTGQNNRLIGIRFSQLQNALVTVNGQAIVAGQTVTAPANSVELDFSVARVTPGQSTTVFLTIIDSCGEWQTFVGGGAAAGF